VFYVVHALTVFSETLILEGNGSTIGVGDSFKLPSTEAKLEIFDDDKELSGDTSDLADDHSGQEGRISFDRLEKDNFSGQFYVEKYLKLEDESGNIYWIAEIEYEGMADDLSSNLLTFVGAVAPEGTTLTVTAVTSYYEGNTGVSYDLLALARDVTEVVNYTDQKLGYDIDAQQQVLTQSVIFDGKQSFDETFDDRKADRVDLRFARDRGSEDGSGEVALRVNIDHHQFDNLDMDQVLAVDTTKLEAWLFEQGAISIAEVDIDLDSYDMNIDVTALGFGGVGGSEDDVEKILSISAPLLGIVYEDNSGETKTAEIELDFSIEDVPTSALSFDLNGNGVIDMMTDSNGEWIDGNGDGVLIDVSKATSPVVTEDALFSGNPDKYSDGYENLSRLDRNIDGVVSGSELSGLSIWVDNGNRILDEGELVALESVGLSEISLETSFDVDGNKISTAEFDKEGLKGAHYSLAGADAEHFVIDQQTGVVNWAEGNAPGPDAAIDADFNNVYELTVLDGAQAIEMLAIEIDDLPVPPEEAQAPTREGRLMDDDRDFFAKINAYSGDSIAVGYNVFGDLIGDDDRDYVYDRTGDSMIFTMDGDDKVYGSDGNDAIHGGNGDDALYGGDGQDILDGGSGNDTLKGGEGIDVFVFRLGEGTTEIEDFELSHDILDVEGFENLTYAELTKSGQQVGDDVYYYLGQDTLILRDLELDLMTEIDLCMR